MVALHHGICMLPEVYDDRGDLLLQIDVQDQSLRNSMEDQLVAS